LAGRSEATVKLASVHDPPEPGWLPAEGVSWLKANQRALDAIAAAFEDEGDWPSPVAIERTARGDGRRLGVIDAVSSMPRWMGWRQWSPDQAVLSIFGLACASGATWMVEAFFATHKLALERFNDPTLEARLTRAMVQERTGLDDRRMRVFTVALLQSAAPFMGSGGVPVSTGEWDYEIDPRVTRYEEAADPAGLIAMLAAERIPPDAVPEWVVGPPPRDPEASTSSERSRPGWVVPGALAAIAVVGFVADFNGVLHASMPVLVGTVAAAAAAWAVHRRLFPPRTDPTAVAIVVVSFVAALVITWGAQHVFAGDRSRTVDVNDFVGQLKQSERESGRTVVYVKRVAFRGAGAPASLFVVLRESRVADPGRGDLPIAADGQPVVEASDEVRVYDPTMHAMQLTARFLPQGSGQVPQLPDGDMPSFHFTPLRVADLDGDGRQEVVGTFDRQTLASGPYGVPVVWASDEGSGAIRLSPLINSTPHLKVPHRANAAFGGFLKPTVIKDRFTTSVLRGYGTSVAGVIVRPSRSLLIAGFLDPLRASRYEARGWTIDLEGGVAETAECPGGHRFVMAQRSPPTVTHLSGLVADLAITPCKP